MKRYLAGLLLALTIMGFAADRLRAGGSPGPYKPAREASEQEIRDWPASLAHHNFVIQKFDDHTFAEKNGEGAPRTWPNISFGQWPDVSGRLCNHFRGTAETAPDGRLKISAAATRMMCLEEPLYQLEKVFQKVTAAGAACALSADGRTLTLSGDGHTLTFSLKDHVD